MSSSISYPIIFEPVLKRILWGGRRLGTILGKSLGPEADYAESWEIADHPNGQSIILWPEAMQGMNLSELMKTSARELLGPEISSRFKQFPLLVKFLDANQDLSLQVHPDDSLAYELVGDNGKNEAWVIIEAEPHSRIYAGLKHGVTREDLQQAMQTQKVGELVHWFEPVPGDCIMIPAGTVHAIGSGILLAEIQQMSDATFRVDDWGRVGPDGQPRQLHLREALLATDFSRGPVEPWPVENLDHPDPDVSHEHLARCPYFDIERWKFSNQIRIGDPEKGNFTIVIVIQGTLTVKSFGNETRKVKKGSTFLLPACLGEVELTSTDTTESVILTCRVPVM